MGWVVRDMESNPEAGTEMIMIGFMTEIARNAVFGRRILSYNPLASFLPSLPVEA